MKLHSILQKVLNNQMNKELIIILKILKSFIKEEIPPFSESNNIDIDKLYQIFLYHGLGGVLYPFITYFYKSINNNEKLQQYNKQRQKAILSHLYQIQDLSLLVGAFDESSLPYIILKGPAISNYYQNPEYRQMGDIDVLVKKNNWIEAEELLIKNGYKKAQEEEYSPLHVEFRKKSRISIELHRRLIHTGYLGERNTSNWYKHIWLHKEIKNYSGINFYAMCSEDELINQVTHFASHFIYIGVSIKHIFEMALIINSKELDWTYIKKILDELDFMKFSCLLFSICESFFGCNIPKYFCCVEKKIQYRFIYDLYEYFSVAKHQGDFNGWINLINNYRYIIRKPLLFPMMWGIVLSAQYNIHGNRIKTIKNSIRNIKIINEKLFFVRNYLFEK